MCERMSGWADGIYILYYIYKALFKLNYFEWRMNNSIRYVLYSVIIYI